MKNFLISENFILCLILYAVQTPSSSFTASRGPPSPLEKA